MTNSSVPFTEESQLYKKPTSSQQSFPASLPGHPRISLQDAVQLRSFLYQELWATDLERMAPHLWIMSTQLSTNLCPLHQQKVKGREIVITEDPRLQLVWIYDRILSSRFQDSFFYIFSGLNSCRLSNPSCREGLKKSRNRRKDTDVRIGPFTDLLLSYSA